MRIPHILELRPAGLRFSRLTIEPTLRYTRWQPDPSPYGIESRPDQIELLAAFSYSPGSDEHPFGSRIFIGAVLGTNLLGDYNPATQVFTTIPSSTQNVGTSRSGPHSFLVGPTAELYLKSNWSVLSAAIYRPVREHYTNTFTFDGQPRTFSGDVSFVTWQFPVLARYQLPVRFAADRLSPFAEAGPSFRTGGPDTHYGFTAGAGILGQWRWLKITPGIRYTRWQSNPINNRKSNEADLLVGFTF